MGWGDTESVRDATYPELLKEQALSKVFGRGGKSA
jgi:hypothetical protein